MVVIYCTLDSVVLLFNIRALNCLGQGGEMLKPRLLSPSSPRPSPYFISPPDSFSSSSYFPHFGFPSNNPTIHHSSHARLGFPNISSSKGWFQNCYIKEFNSCSLNHHLKGIWPKFQILLNIGSLRLFIINVLLFTLRLLNHVFLHYIRSFLLLCLFLLILLPSFPPTSSSSTLSPNYGQ